MNENMSWCLLPCGPWEVAGGNTGASKFPWVQLLRKSNSICGYVKTQGWRPIDGRFRHSFISLGNHHDLFLTGTQRNTHSPCSLTQMGHGLLSHGAQSQALYSVTMVASHLKSSSLYALFLPSLTWSSSDECNRVGEPLLFLSLELFGLINL